MCVVKLLQTVFVLCVPWFMMTSQTDNFPIFGPCYDLADPPQFHRPHFGLHPTINM